MKPPEAVAIAFYITIALFTVVFGYKAVNTNPPLPCGVSEISPDISTEVREKCRQMREQRAQERRGHKL
jgi:hypothetical protein